MFERMLARRAQYVPASGYNVIGLDEYGDDPEGSLYLVQHVDKLEDARAAQADNGDKTFILGSDGEAVE